MGLKISNEIKTHLINYAKKLNSFAKEILLGEPDKAKNELVNMALADILAMIMGANTDIEIVKLQLDMQRIMVDAVKELEKNNGIR